MKKINYPLLRLLICILFMGCVNDRRESKEIYNQKANEIIIQTLKDNNCNCLLEIPKESLIELMTLENPRYDIRSSVMKQLKTRNSSNLDSLVNVSKGFSLNLTALKKNNIKIITQESLLSIKKDSGNEILKTCPNGIIYFSKPIFNKTYQKAVLDYGSVFTCIKTLPLPVYEFKNKKWNLVE
ncbi:hypothetical protein [uncultured Flavobacterium sp.]|uniref:hypothetical protein n=1 Tax=uncultured Flavobacterium sp. TaxID=165435 RepID=UPI003081CFCB